LIQGKNKKSSAEILLSGCESNLKKMKTGDTKIIKAKDQKGKYEKNKRKL